MTDRYFENHRILIIDDLPAIHADFRRILDRSPKHRAFSSQVARLFEEPENITDDISFQVTSAFQGLEGAAVAAAANRAGLPFALAFVDMRMPPGMDGLETIQCLWKDDPRLQVVICTAYSDHTWAQVLKKLGRTDNLLLLRKPFDMDEVYQLALSQTSKWSLARQVETTHADLQLQIAKRTAELEIVTQQAQAATLAKSQFLAKISHEIRTPLNGMIVSTDLLQRTDLNPEQKQLVNVATTCGRNLLTLVNDILDWSKIEAGKMELQCTAFDLRQVVEESVQMLSQFAASKGLQLRGEIAADLCPDRWGDPNRVGQILLNLINNAIKFTSSGSVTLNVLNDPSEGPGELVRFEVIDTGPGISSEDTGRLFKSFSRLDETGIHAGTGLGLAICKELVEAMGGQIGVKSGVGLGATFWFTARLPSQPSTAAPSPATDPAALATPSFSTGALKKIRRVLIADDNETNRLIAQKGLAHHGIESVAVCNGVEAMQAIETGHFDLVLMDCQMPVMNGFEATRLIRTSKSEWIRHIPIIAVTASTIAGERERCLAAGMSGLVTKPLDLGMLPQTLETILDEQGSSIVESVSAPFDLDEVLHRCLHDIGFVQSVLGKFQQRVDGDYQALKLALAMRDGEDTRQKAHGFQGLAANVGAKRLRQLAQDVEASVRESDFNVADQSFAALSVELERCLKYLPHASNELVGIHGPSPQHPHT